MQAALEHIDDFMPAHNLRSLEDLATHLQRLGTAAGLKTRAYIDGNHRQA